MLSRLAVTPDARVGLHHRGALLSGTSSTWGSEVVGNIPCCATTRHPLVVGPGSAAEGLPHSVPPLA